MSIRWLTRKTKGAPMPIEFKPFSVPITLRGVTNRLSEIIQDRPLAICLQGKSIQELEDRIKEFKDVNICWGAMNRFDIYQNYILSKIGKKLQVVMDVGEVKNVEDYEKAIRVPRWSAYLQNSDSLIITSEEILQNIKTYSQWDIEAEYPNQLIIIEKCRHIQVPNSIMLYLMVLAKFNVRKIILFGFDGFGHPPAFKDAPLWNAEEMETHKYLNKTITAYYRPETCLEERRIGYGNERVSDLHSNSPTMNDQYRKTMGLFCKENNLVEPDIVNCSIKALYTIFRKISYDRLHGELQ